MAIVLAVALPMMIFISRIPYPDDANLDRHEEPRIIVALVKYLFLPLLGAYMLVLYIYGIKILNDLYKRFYTGPALGIWLAPDIGGQREQRPEYSRVLECGVNLVIPD